MTDLFEKATRDKIRIPSSKGALTAEDLWDLPLTQLNSLAKIAYRKVQISDEIDFLNDKTKEDEEAKLTLDLILYILDTKKDEKEQRKKAVELKAQKEKIKEIIVKKQDENLESKSEEELLKLLEEMK